MPVYRPCGAGLECVSAVAWPASGVTAAASVAGGSGSGAGYSNWELSSDRANASRRELRAGGLADARVLRVQGLAASVPFDRQSPLDPVNRRISIIVMTRDAEERFFQSGDAPLPEEDAASEPAQASSPVPAHR